MARKSENTPERRTFRRTDVVHDVEIESTGSGGVESPPAPLRGKLVNVGCGGVLARVDRLVNVGTRCEVRILDAEQGQEGKVAHGVVRRSLDTQRGALLAIEFLDRVDTLPAGAGAEQAPKALPSRVLVVDDEADVRKLLERFLIRRGCTVDVAADGQEALDVVRRRRPDMVFLDIRMPKLDGLQVLRRIREEELKIGSIWAISGYASDDEACEALRLGAADFMSKPLDLQYLDWSLKMHRVAT